MAKKTHGLGRGLDSLFSESDEWGSDSIQEIGIGNLDPNPDQPRRIFHEESIAQLADSIREQGVLQPLLVVETENGRYRIIAGERRYRACRIAGMERVPCIVKDLDIIHQMEISLIENLQREDLNPLEAAKGIEALMRQCGYTQEKVSARLGKSRPAVANLLRLLSLPEEVQKLVREGQLSAGHARVIAGVSGKASQIRMAVKAVSEGLSVRQTEELAAAGKKAAGRKPPERKRLSAEMGDLQDRIREKTGMKSTLKGSVNKGSILLQYSTREELEHLCEVLQLDWE